MADVAPAGKPIQRISESEKNKDGKKFFRQTADFYINGAVFDDNASGYGMTMNVGPDTGTNLHRRSKKLLYEVYNNQIPQRWFDHITNPLNSEKPEYTHWPSKIRPTTILRTNIDLFCSEYPKRPFSYFVSNLGEDGYTAYVDSLNDVINKTLQRKFIQIAQQQAAAQGQDMGHTAAAIAQQDIPTPDEVATAYKASYKDKQAIKGQKKLKRAITATEFRRKTLKMFKDWLIAGEALSFKGVKYGKIDYRRFSPLNCDWDKSQDMDFIEDGEWFVSRSLMTISDICDQFYDELDESDWTDIERAQFSNVGAFYSYLDGLYTDGTGRDGRLTKIPVYHVTWKGKKKLKKITHTDPTTGEVEVDYLDEAYVTTQGEKSEAIWVNCVYETTRVGDKVYLGMGELQHQVSQMNNYSYCKLPYNGRCFSDTHAQNISILEIGLPFQIMYIIATNALEMTIAKSGGKIVLLDKNVIPKGAGWDEDKFFYYAKALGWGLINRNQVGVDKSYNQYQVLDLTLFDSMKQLIELKQSIKDEWDDVTGVSRQRKAETYASDTAAGNQAALLQSNVMTDMIFIGFEEFIERELQGLLDLTRFEDLDGARRLYNLSEFDQVLIDSDPNEYAMAELGVFVTNASVEGKMLQKLEGYTQAMIQNGLKASTVIEMLTAENVATLKAVMHKAEDLEAQAAQAQQQSQEQQEQALEEIKERYARLESSLKIDEINAEWDRKDANEYIVGQFQIDAAKDGSLDRDNNGIPDATEVQKNALEVAKIASSERIEAAKLKNEELERAHTEKLHARDNATKRAEIAARERIDKMKARSTPKK